MPNHIFFGPADQRYLQYIRRYPEYMFRLYKNGFSKQGGNGDVYELLLDARDFFCEELIALGERIVLAKARLSSSSVILSIDQDYFEIIYQDKKGSFHLADWQFAKDWKGLSLDALEYFMAYFLPDIGESSSPENRREQLCSYNAANRGFWAETQMFLDTSNQVVSDDMI